MTTSSWVDNIEEYNSISHSVEPTVKLRTKDSWLWSAIWIVPVVFTLGFFALAMGRTEFLTKWATTFVPIQGYPRIWLSLGRRLLVHEARHTYQCVVAALFVPIIGWVPWRKWRAYVGLVPMGLVPMGLVYVLLFPVMLCYGRYRLELDADIVSWSWALKEKTLTPDEIRDHAARRIDSVGGKSYFFPWPKPLVRRGYDTWVERVISEAA